MSPAPWATHFGLARTPFGKSIPARDLFPRQAHAEAIARISFCVVESALGVVTGDVGGPPTDQPRSPPRPPHSSPPSTANAEGSRCWSSMRPTCWATPSWRRSGSSRTPKWTPPARSPAC